MKLKTNVYLGSCFQLAVALILLWLTRWVFIAYNYSAVDISTWVQALEIGWNGLRYDISILAYANAVFILMRFAPFPWMAHKGWLAAGNVIFWITNSLLLILNVGDTPYFQFTAYRMTWLNFVNVITDPNSAGMMSAYVGQFWWAYLLAVVLVAALVWITSRVEFVFTPEPLSKYAWVKKICIFLIAGGLTVLGIRGMRLKGRPLDTSSAVWYVDTMPQINAVLNTPFCIFRTINRSMELQRLVYFSEEELASIRNSLTMPSHCFPKQDKNLVLIIIESGGSIFSEHLTPLKEDRQYAGTMVFLDSLARQSLVNRHLWGTGRTSCQGITNILGGFPDYGIAYYVTSKHNLDILDSPARLMNRMGMVTKFYYGCEKGSFHIDETAKATGFGSIYSRDDYGPTDYDGSWGVWDHKMAEFVVEDLSHTSNPFFATWFTVSAHGPYNLPEDIDTSGYRHRQESPEQAIEYTDYALRYFFDMAKQTSWYENTIFVITADHGARDYANTVYNNTYVYNHLPFIVYAPDGSVPVGAMEDRMMSQVDIGPTLLSLVGYEKPYIALGTSMFDDARPHYALTYSNGQYYVAGTEYMVAYDTPDTPAAVYDVSELPAPETRLVDYDTTKVDEMTRWIKAFFQDYTSRMIDNRMSVESR